jgi:hypothetical protein
MNPKEQVEETMDKALGAVNPENVEVTKQVEELNLDSGNRSDFRKRITSILKGLVSSNSHISNDLGKLFKFSNELGNKTHNLEGKFNQLAQETFERGSENNLIFAMLFNFIPEDKVEYADDKGPYPLSLYFGKLAYTEKVSFVPISVPSNEYRYFIKILNNEPTLVKFKLLNQDIRNYKIIKVDEELKDEDERNEVKKFKITFVRESKLKTTEDIQETLFIEVHVKNISVEEISNTAYYELYKKLYVDSKE